MTKIAALVMAALSGISALFIKIFSAGKIQEGRLEERNDQRAKESEAKAVADKVLSEHRDPDDAARRLRNGDF